MDPQMSVGRTTNGTLTPVTTRPAEGRLARTDLVYRSRVGSVVGTGIFTMPAVLAGAGTVSILVLVVGRGGRNASRGAVRPAHQASAEQ